jgi:hypothetical protein
MACTRNRSKIWGDYVLAATVSLFTFLPSEALAAFASQFSLSVGEQYTDNLFFAKKKEHDFVTIITPTLSLYYAPTGEAVPTLNFSISPSGQIYARHSDLSGFGFNSNSNASLNYVYQYSPRLTFSVSDSFQPQGRTRLADLPGGFQSPLTPTSPIPTNVQNPQTQRNNLRNFVQGGANLSNVFAFQGNFQVRPEMSINGGYSHTYTSFTTLGGSDSSQSFSLRGVYNYLKDHNLHVGYTGTIANSRNGDSGFIHDFDFGDDYFTGQDYTIQITPTLSLSASTGISINTSSSGPRVANNSTVTVTKLWETAAFSAGLRKGLVPSYGISGVSDSTSLFSNFGIQLSERASANANANFSYNDSKDVNFTTFEAATSLQYQLATWLSTSLSYTFRSINSGAGAVNTELLSRGRVNSNSVFLVFTTRFDLWPNTGLARSQPFSSMSPVLRTPFPSAPAPSTPPASPTSTSIN